MDQKTPQVSIICPAYNEQAAIGQAIAKLQKCLDGLPYSAEVLLINDGSTDATVELAKRAIAGDRRFRLFSHLVNHGRGRALRTGFAEAAGEIIVTTEADLSWGEEVIQRMVEALSSDPGADAVFASPHLPGGGYQNVPGHRVFLSTQGNRFLKFLNPQSQSMITGMTRAYRARVIKPHVFSQDGKEIHLEIAYRLNVLGCKVLEVPAILSWPQDKTGPDNRAKRTNWRKIWALVVSHLMFGAASGGNKLFGMGLAAITLIIGVFSFWALIRLIITHEPSIYLVTLIGVLMVLWATLGAAFLLYTRSMQQEVTAWRTEAQLSRLLEACGRPAHGQEYYKEEDLG